MADSIREALTAAFEAAPADETTSADDQVSNVATSGEVSSQAPDSGPAAEVAAPDSAAADTPASAGTPSAATEAAGLPTPPAVEPPPASWTKEERAAWAALPEAARKAVARRESEMQRAFQTSAEARRRVETLDKLANVYKPLLDQYGVTVEQAMPGLLATRAVLEVGTPQQKADLIANVCADFGLNLEMLDTALASRYPNGQPVQRAAPPQPVNLAAHPELAPLVALAAEVKARQADAARAAIAEIADNPHYETVRFTMADLIDKAKEQGRSLDVKAALRLALQFHGLEDTAPAPTPQQTISDAARTLAAARNAATSVSGAPKPAPARKPGEGTLREELEANLAATVRR